MLLTIQVTIKKVLEDFMLENFFPKSPNPFGLQFLFTSIECFWHLACAGIFQACLLCMILCCCCCCCRPPPPPTPSSTRQILKARVSVHKERNFETLKSDLLWSVYRGNRMKTKCRAICTPAAAIAGPGVQEKSLNIHVEEWVRESVTQQSHP